ncbi:MAG: hypothetical protein ABIK32_08220 [Chloroflexota bacterium]|nr:hypothetical protein [Chloroflexota bacterium]
MFRKSESGQTIVIALILLAVGSLLVIPVLNHVFTNLNYNQTIECRTLNDYSADAGVQYATCKIYNNAAAYAESAVTENFTANDRTVDVTIEYIGGGLYSINSTAHGGGCGSTTIRSFVNISHGSFAYALAAKQDLTINNTNVDTHPDQGLGAPIHSNINIDISGPPKGERKIWGDASAVGTITGEGYVTGNVTQGSDNLTFPTTNAELYKTIAQEGGTVDNLEFSGGGTFDNVGPKYVTGNMIVDAWTTVVLAGPLYIDGYLQVNNGNIEGREHIICEGDVQILGGGYGSEDIPVITSLYGDITLQGPVVDAVLYAPNGTVLLENLELYGAAGGLQVTVDNSLIWYSEKLHGRADLPGSELYPLTYSYD